MGLTALHVAASRGAAAVAAQLLQAAPELLTATDSKGRTAADIACLVHRPEAAAAAEQEEEEEVGLTLPPTVL